VFQVRCSRFGCGAPFYSQRRDGPQLCPACRRGLSRTTATTTVVQDNRQVLLWFAVFVVVAAWIAILVVSAVVM
jgi:hypothetical protein